MVYIELQVVYLFPKKGKGKKEKPWSINHLEDIDKTEASYS